MPETHNTDDSTDETQAAPQERIQDRIAHDFIDVGIINEARGFDVDEATYGHVKQEVQKQLASLKGTPETQGPSRKRTSSKNPKLKGVRRFAMYFCGACLGWCCLPGVCTGHCAGGGEWRTSVLGQVHRRRSRTPDC